MGGASLDTVLGHRRNHEWSDVPGRIRRECNFISQENEIFDLL